MAFFFGGGASVDLASPPAIGNTTPNTGAFTSLTVKASTGLSDRSITGSGTTSGFSIESSNAYILTTNQYAARLSRGGDLGVTIRSDSAFGITSGAADATPDTILRRDGADTFAQRRSTNAQAFRIYNTFTSSTNFERLNFRWASDEFILDAEKGSAGGTLRGIKIGSAITSLLGFYGVTPVDQPATVTDPTGGGTQDAEARTAINAIIDRLQELGLIA